MEPLSDNVPVYRLIMTCPNCKVENSGATPIDDDKLPEANIIGICGDCLMPFMYLGDGKTRCLTEEEKQKVLSDFDDDKRIANLTNVIEKILTGNIDFKI